MIFCPLETVATARCRDGRRNLALAVVVTLVAADSVIVLDAVLLQVFINRLLVGEPADVQNGDGVLLRHAVAGDGRQRRGSYGRTGRILIRLRILGVVRELRHELDIAAVREGRAADFGHLRFNARADDIPADERMIREARIFEEDLLFADTGERVDRRVAGGEYRPFGAGIGQAVGLADDQLRRHIRIGVLPARIGIDGANRVDARLFDAEIAVVHHHLIVRVPVFETDLGTLGAGCTFQVLLGGFVIFAVIVHAVDSENDIDEVDRRAFFDHEFRGLRPVREAGLAEDGADGISTDVLHTGVRHLLGVVRVPVLIAYRYAVGKFTANRQRLFTAVYVLGCAVESDTGKVDLVTVCSVLISSAGNDGQYHRGDEEQEQKRLPESFHMIPPKKYVAPDEWKMSGLHTNII